MIRGASRSMGALVGPWGGIVQKVGGLGGQK